VQPSISTEETWCLPVTADMLICFHSAALCQIYDSIFLDVPMNRVRFNVNTEYAYIQNFKILQSESQPRVRRLGTNTD